MASNDELACIYSALILVDDEIEVTVSSVHQISFKAILSVKKRCSNFIT